MEWSIVKKQQKLLEENVAMLISCKNVFHFFLSDSDQIASSKAKWEQSKENVVQVACNNS
jgi:hypothetical protein